MFVILIDNLDLQVFQTHNYDKYLLKRINESIGKVNAIISSIIFSREVLSFQ